MKTCYRHSSRETGVSCSSCDRPICPDCMTPTPVGMRCPECSRQTTTVRTAAAIARGTDPIVTYVIIALNVLAFIGSTSAGAGLTERGGGSVIQNGALNGFAVNDGEVWRIVTGGFLHAGLLHIAFNMYLLYVLGQMLEPAIGRVRYVALFVVSLLAGSLGALIAAPDVNTVGASGAVFGLMGAAFVGLRARGIDPMQSGLGPTILLNLAITFLIPGISIGGHIGGLVGGAAAGWLLLDWGERRRSKVLPLLAVAAIGVAAVVGSLFAAAATPGLS